MKIKAWAPPSDQFCNVGRHQWSVSRLHELSRNLPVMEVPVDHIYTFYKYDDLTLKDMVMHMKAVNDANLSMPILLDEDGVLMDGRHRLMKALLIGAATIKVSRFEENPSPCRTSD